MSARVVMAMTVGFLLLTAGCGSGHGGAETGPAESEPLDVADTAAELRWEREWDEAFTRADEEDKAVLVDFYADWCVWCKKLDTTTYSDPEVVGMVDRHMVALKVDVDGDGRARARKWGVSGLPTILVVSADGRELGRIPGYLPADEFLDQLQRILS